jgi:hypothetical protein
MNKTLLSITIIMASVMMVAGSVNMINIVFAFSLTDFFGFGSSSSSTSTQSCSSGPNSPIVGQCNSFVTTTKSNPVE